MIEPCMRVPKPTVDRSSILVLFYYGISSPRILTHSFAFVRHVTVALINISAATGVCILYSAAMHTEA